MNRKNISSGSAWEEIVGYSRAVRVGNVVEVSGTTAVDNGAVTGLHDYYKQTHFILGKIEKALKESGCEMKDVIRSRIYVCDISKWEDVAKAHAEFFKDIKPASTMVEVSKLIAPELLVEIEVSALITDK